MNREQFEAVVEGQMLYNIFSNEVLKVRCVYDNGTAVVYVPFNDENNTFGKEMNADDAYNWQIVTADPPNGVRFKLLMLKIDSLEKKIDKLLEDK